MKTFQPCSFFVLLLLSTSPASAQNGLGIRIDSLFRSYTDSGLAGSVLVIHDGHPLLRKGYGYANNELKIPNTSNTLFNVASIGKQFTVYAVLQLERAGRLKTSDYLHKYVGRFGDVRDSVTLFHLLHHRSGMVKDGVELNYKTRVSFIQSVKSVEPESVPGKKFRYSNAGYTMLAAVVEIASRMPFEDYLRKNIFLPLGMKDTGYPWENHIPKKRVATGYDSKGQALPAESDEWGARGPGNLVTTMDDLYRWMQAYDNKAFMPPATKKRILYDSLPGQETYSWNRAKTSRGTTLYHKGGGRRDFESRLMWWPEEKLLVVFSLNNDYNIARKLFAAIRQMVN